MTVELITGQGGTAHIGSEDVGAYQAYTFGTGCYILDGCEATIVNSNTIRISAGELMIEGRHIRVIGGEDINIQSGAVGHQRIDLIVIRYTKDGDGIETASLIPVIGTPTTGIPEEPSYIEGSILAQDIAVDIPLYRIAIDGITPDNPVCLIDRTAPFAGRMPLPGVIYPYAGTSAPNGFLMCDGAWYYKNEYPELYAVIGTTYGSSSDGRFKVPDLRGRVAIGSSSSYKLGYSGGEEAHKLTLDEMPTHQHVAGEVGASDGTLAHDGKYVAAANLASDGNIGWSLKTSTQGGNKAHNNMQPYTVTNYIISTGRGGGVSVMDIVQGARAIPLSVEVGGTGATDAAGAREALGAFPASGGTIDGDLTVNGRFYVPAVYLPYEGVLYGKAETGSGYHPVMKLRGGLPPYFDNGIRVRTGTSVGSDEWSSFTFMEGHVAASRPVRDHFMVCSNAKEVSFTATSGHSLDMTSVEQNNTDLLTTENGGIRCGVDGFVEVSGVVNITGADAWDSCGGFVQINRSANGNSNISSGLHFAVATSAGGALIPIESRVFQVQAGDVVKLMAYNTVAARGKAPASQRNILTVKYC